MTSIDLSEILYVDEAAKTANDAVAMDYAVFAVRPDGQTMYVLADANEARQSLAKVFGILSFIEGIFIFSTSFILFYLSDTPHLEGPYGPGYTVSTPCYGREETSVT